MRDHQMHRCVVRSIAMLILDFMKFVVWESDFLISWLGFLHDFVELTSLPFQALHLMKPQRVRNDGVGRGRHGNISSTFHAHGKEGLLLVSECWTMHQVRNSHIQNVKSLVFPDISNE
jgi:hypothetical protein